MCNSFSLGRQRMKNPFICFWSHSVQFSHSGPLYEAICNFIYLLSWNRNLIVLCVHNNRLPTNSPGGSPATVTNPTTYIIESLFFNQNLIKTHRKACRAYIRAFNAAPSQALFVTVQGVPISGGSFWSILNIFRFLKYIFFLDPVKIQDVLNNIHSIIDFFSLDCLWQIFSVLCDRFRSSVTWR